MITPNYYTAKIHSYSLKFVGDDNKPVAEIVFAVQTPEGEQMVPYRGFLTEKAKGYTVRDLVTLGFGDQDMSRFAKGLESGALDAQSEYRVKVIVEEYKGSHYPKVKGIYSKRSKSELTFDQLAQAGKITVAGEVMAAKASIGVRTTGALSSKTATKAEGGNLDDLSF